VQKTELGSKAFIHSVPVCFLKSSLSFISVSLKIDDGFEVKRTQRKALFVFICKSAKYEVVLGVFAAFDIKVIFYEIEENPFHFIDLAGLVCREGLSEVIIFKGLIVPNFGRYDKCCQSDFSPSFSL
jgi:hypothetical protein